MTMNKRKITLEIETVKAGQPRPYADHEYEFILTVNGMNEIEVKQYCTRVLRPCKQTYGEWDKQNMDSYFAGYYRFIKVGENQYKYFVTIPYCG